MSEQDSYCSIAQSHHIVKYLGHVIEAGAYLINLKTARIYMRDFFPISLPYDYFYNQPWKHNIRFKGLEPRMIHHMKQDMSSKILSSTVLQDIQITNA
jgi:hypothetical protein